MKKLLITGSAPYLPEWWKNNVIKLDEFEVYSLNTSILITYKRCDCWYRSDDFFDLHRDQEQFIRFHAPSIDARFRKKYPAPDLPHSTGSYSWPFRYWDKGSGGTMLFDILSNFLNRSFWKNDVEEVDVIGCDLVYKDGQQNHFYKGGFNDPWRLGDDGLRVNLKMFKMAYDRIGVKLYNLSPSEETLLPFERKTL